MERTAFDSNTVLEGGDSLEVDESGDETSTALQLHRTLAEHGFTQTFRIENNLLCCLESGQNYTSERVRILGIYRFEGMSDPVDLSIVYALEAEDGTRGTIVEAFGSNGSNETSDFLKNAQDLRANSGLAELPTERQLIIETQIPQ